MSPSPNPRSVSDKIESICLKAQHENQFTAWAWATPEMATSVYYADEAGPHLKGLDPQPSGFHPRFDLASLTKPLLGSHLLHKFNLWDKSVRETLEMWPNYLSPLIEILEEKKISWSTLANHEMKITPWMWMGAGYYSFKETASPYAHFPGKMTRAFTGAPNREGWFTHLSWQLTHAFKHAQKGTANHYSDLNYMAIALLLPWLKGALTNRGQWNWQDIMNEHNSAIATDFRHCALEYQTHHAIPFCPYLAIQGDFTGNGHSWGSCHDLNQNIFTGPIDALQREWHWPKPTQAFFSLHAGLFGSVVDVLKALGELSQLHFSRLANFGKHEHIENSRFVYGLDTPSGDTSTSGLSPNTPLFLDTFGHLGYTGPMFWFNSKQSMVFLCNRTATRRHVGVYQIPLLKVYSELKTHTHSFFMKLPQEKVWKEISLEHFLALQSECRGVSQIHWDDSVAQLPPDVNGIRRMISQTIFGSTQGSVGNLRGYSHQ